MTIKWIGPKTETYWYAEGGSYRVAEDANGWWPQEGTHEGWEPIRVPGIEFGEPCKSLADAQAACESDAKAACEQSIVNKD